MAREIYTSHPKSQEFDVQALLNSQSAKQGFFCLSPTTWELAYNLVIFYGDWRSRYYYTDVDGQQLTVTDEEYEDIQAAVQTALEELQMACDLSAVLEKQAEIQLQIAQLIAGQGTQGTQTECVTGDFICINTNEINENGTDEADPVTGTYGPGDVDIPDGFEDQADYLQYKCEVANLIFDGAVKALRTTGGITAIFAVGQVIAATLISATAGTIIILPPLGFAALVAAVIAVLAAGLGTTAILNHMADAMEDDRDEIICRLYAAANTTAAVNSVIDEVENLFETVLIAAAVPAPLEGAATTFLGAIAAGIFNNDTVNQLFTLVANIAYAGADCSECGTSDPCGFEIQYGSGTFNYLNQTFTLQSEPLSTVHVLNFYLPVACTDGNWCLKFNPNPDLNDTSVNYNRVWWLADNGVRLYLQTQCDYGHAPYNGNFPDDDYYPCSGIEITNDTAFSVTFRISGYQTGNVGTGPFVNPCVPD